MTGRNSRLPKSKLNTSRKIPTKSVTFHLSAGSLRVHVPLTEVAEKVTALCSVGRVELGDAWELVLAEGGSIAAADLSDLLLGDCSGLEQLATARQRDLPVSLHVRGDEPDAFGEALDLWRAEGRGELRGVLHCYTGSLEFALRALDAGLDVSFSGILTFKRDRGLREVARALPLDRLMVETDAPLLAPEGFRGRRNEPARVTRVGRTLAETRGIPVEEVARQTTRNARRLFRLPESPEEG